MLQCEVLQFQVPANYPSKIFYPTLPLPIFHFVPFQQPNQNSAWHPALTSFLQGFLPHSPHKDTSPHTHTAFIYFCKIQNSKRHPPLLSGVRVLPLQLAKAPHSNNSLAVLQRDGKSYGGCAPMLQQLTSWDRATTPMSDIWELPGIPEPATNFAGQLPLQNKVCSFRSRVLSLGAGWF